MKYTRNRKLRGAERHGWIWSEASSNPLRTQNVDVVTNRDNGQIVLDQQIGR